jgi:transposase
MVFVVIIAIINGTEAKKIEEVLLKLPLESRNKVKEISMDMAPNIALASRNCFTKSSLVIDRFHVVRLVCDAMQHLRTQLRWKVIDDEMKPLKNQKIKV